MTDLIFKRGQSHNTNLVFGAGEQAAIDPAYVYLDVDTGAVAVDWHLSVATPMDGVLDTDAVDVEMALRWDSNVYRPFVSKAMSRTQAAMVLRMPIHFIWQGTYKANHASCTRKQQAKRAGAASSIVWQITQPLGVRSQARYQQADRVSAAATKTWQRGAALQAMSGARWQQADAVSDAASFVLQFGAPARMARSLRWQPGAPVARAARGGFGQAVVVGKGTDARWQPAMWPMPGKSKLQDHAQARDDVCYTPPPGDQVHLLFMDSRDGANLLFACRRRRGSSAQSQIIVPVLDVYMHLHDLSATLWPSGEPVALSEATISTDDGGYAWQMSASGAVWLMEQLAPENGQQKLVRIEIDGFAWIFAIQSRTRNRQWPTHTVSVTGASVTSLLGAMPVTTFANDEPRMAQQLVHEAVDTSGTTLDWRLPDWQIPGGVWSHQGTPLSAALAVGDAVGAVVQSHPTAQTLIYMPRYASMPWEWAAATPDVVLPIGYAETDSFEEVREPAYNKVYTAGTVAGSIKPTRRAGTPGDVQAPMAIDALLTHSLAHTERAKAILGAAGWKASVTMTLPVNTSAGHPGVLPMGGLVRVKDTDGDWFGMVRGVSVKAGGSASVTQTVRLERHLA